MTSAVAALHDDRSQLIEEQVGKLFAMQREDGHLVFELEADATIPAEYILLLRFLGETRPEEEKGIGNYLRHEQNSDGSWPLFSQGAGDLSATIKAYWALKIIGDAIDAPHMLKARNFILSQGGAARANVFTRYTLALFGQIPWHGAPSIPVEVMHLPKWFPFHTSKIAYWSRTVMVPLLVLVALKARAADCSVSLRELFLIAPEDETKWQINPNGTAIGSVFLALDKVLHAVQDKMPKPIRAKAIKQAEDFVIGHLNGEDGLGAIYPAMANAVMMMHIMGYSQDDPSMKIARKSIELLQVKRGDQLYVQPCVSPVWDTGLSAHALLEAGEASDPRLAA
ncbi:MAG: squalene--hopene cyclase, partial [Pseudomonadota bacterium]